MHVQTGLAGSQRCVVWLNSRDYVEVAPHALLPHDHVTVEYVLNGFVKGRVAARSQAAMKLQLDILRGEHSATEFLHEKVFGERRWPATIVGYKEQD